jgi:transposase
MKVTFHSYWRMPEALWRRFQRLIPKKRRSPKGGRPALDPRRVADGIYFVLRTGCPWKAVPREFGSGSALHNYFQEWRRRGVFRRLWKQGLAEYDHRQGIRWNWLTLDTATNKAPLGGEKNREKPDRSRQTRRQAVGADRCPRGGPRFGDRGSECP